MLKSIISLIAGFAIMAFSEFLATILAASLITVDLTNPSAQFLVVRIGYVTLVSGLGGYSTASLAPERRSGHAMMLAIMIMVMHSYSIMNPTLGFPRSHFVWLLILCPAAAIAGGKLRELQLQNRPKKS